jgi:hypothetical protein
MYIDHPSFEKPDNADAKVWRYLNFTKFLSLIDKEALYFSRLDCLGDPFEGSVTLVDKDNKHRAIENAANLWANMGVPYNPEEHKQIDTKINENERRRLL